VPTVPPTELLRRGCLPNLLPEPRPGGGPPRLQTLASPRSIVRGTDTGKDQSRMERLAFLGALDWPRVLSAIAGAVAAIAAAVGTFCA
jgi:hypothetical protein